MTDSEQLIPCVGALIYDPDGRLLLVQRRNEPGRGLWSLPGGKVEPGEDDAGALTREMAEETGLTVVPGALAGRVRRGPFSIADYHCTVLGGTLTPGDDASDARWCDAATMATLPLVGGLLDALEDWNALPRS